MAEPGKKHLLGVFDVSCPSAPREVVAVMTTLAQALGRRWMIATDPYFQETCAVYAHPKPTFDPDASFPRCGVCRMAMFSTRVGSKSRGRYHVSCALVLTSTVPE